MGGSSSTPGAWFARTFLTDGEGEFLSVWGPELQDRLEAGMASLTASVGSAPEGFVPPAWLSNADLVPAVERLGSGSPRTTFTWSICAPGGL